MSAPLSSRIFKHLMWPYRAAKWSGTCPALFCLDNGKVVCTCAILLNFKTYLSSSPPLSSKSLNSLTVLFPFRFPASTQCRAVSPVDLTRLFTELRLFSSKYFIQSNIPCLAVKWSPFRPWEILLSSMDTVSVSLANKAESISFGTLGSCFTLPHLFYYWGLCLLRVPSSKGLCHRWYKLTEHRSLQPLAPWLLKR